MLSSFEAEAKGILRCMREAASHTHDVRHQIRLHDGMQQENRGVKVWADGAFSHINKAVRSGGILRRVNGEMVEAFSFQLQDGDSFVAELWGCLMGLRRA